MRSCMKVHYPSFDSKLLISAGNDQRLLAWDQGRFERRSNPSSRDDGGGVGDETSRARASPKSNKKKGKAKGAGKGNSALPKSVRPASHGSTSTEQLPAGVGVGAGTSESPQRREESNVVRCSTPLLSMRLEEKPNWVASLVVPYPALAIADTSSVVKILRRSGT